MKIEMLSNIEVFDKIEFFEIVSFASSCKSSFKKDLLMKNPSSLGQKHYFVEDGFFEIAAEIFNDY